MHIPNPKSVLRKVQLVQIHCFFLFFFCFSWLAKVKEPSLPNCLAIAVWKWVHAYPKGVWVADFMFYVTLSAPYYRWDTYPGEGKIRYSKPGVARLATLPHSTHLLLRPWPRHWYSVAVDWYSEFNSMSTRLGLSYAEMLWICVYCTFILGFVWSCFMTYNPLPNPIYMYI